jgi:hypothetical protein
LGVVCESQEKESQSGQVDLEFGEKFPALRGLSTMEKLELLDGLLELNENPILWLKKENPAREFSQELTQELTKRRTREFSLEQERQESFKAVERLVSKSGVDAKAFVQESVLGDLLEESLLDSPRFL